MVEKVNTQQQEQAQAANAPASQQVSDERKARPTTAELLDQLALADGTAAVDRHRRLRADLALAEKALDREREAQKARASRPQRNSAIKSQSAKVKADANALKHAKAKVSKAKAALEAQGLTVAGYAATSLQFLYMARASTIAGGTIHNPPGIQGDISVVPGGAESAQTLHYTIRFLKGWTYGVTELFGEKLPITYGRSSPAVPWETGSDGAVLPASESPRNAMLDIIVYAHEQKLLSWIAPAGPAARAGWAARAGGR